MRKSTEANHADGRLNRGLEVTDGNTATTRSWHRRGTASRKTVSKTTFSRNGCSESVNSDPALPSRLGACSGEIVAKRMPRTWVKTRACGRQLTTWCVCGPIVGLPGNATLADVFVTRRCSAGGPQHRPYLPRFLILRFSFFVLSFLPVPLRTAFSAAGANGSLRPTVWLLTKS